MCDMRGLGNPQQATSQGNSADGWGHLALSLLLIHSNKTKTEVNKKPLAPDKWKGFQTDGKSMALRPLVLVLCQLLRHFFGCAEQWPEGLVVGDFLDLFNERSDVIGAKSHVV